MATLTGQNIANTYKQLLQVGSDNAGLTASVQTIQDGSGTNSALQLSQSAVNINGTFQLNGTTLTATASALNAVPDITAYTGFIAVSGTNINGRTLTGGTGVSISNADGTEGNPVIALNTTGVTSGTYGPATNFEVNAVGQVVSAGAATSVSVSAVTANTFVGGTFEGTTGNFSSNVSVGGDLTITGAFSPAIVSTSAVNATTGTFSSTVSAAFFIGDGSGLTNVPSAEGGTVKRIEAGQGIKITVDGAVSSSIPVSGTVAVSADQNFGTVSVSTAIAVTGSAKFGVVSATEYYGDGSNLTGVIQTSVSAYTVNQLSVVSAASFPDDATLNFGTGNDLQIVHNGSNSIIKETGTGSLFVQSNEIKLTNTGSFSMLTLADGQDAAFPYGVQVSGTVSATSFVGPTITSINSVISNVSALTSVNAAAITSINAVIEGDVSADSGTFNTLTVITSASIGGTLNVGGNTTLGDAASDITQSKGGFAAQGTGLPSSGSGVEINFGVVAGEGTVQAFDRDLSAWEQLRLRGNQVAFDISGSEKMRITSSGNVLIGTTTNPASQRMVVLGGGVQFSGGTSAQEGLRIQRASGYASITGINNDNNAFNAISFFTSGTAALHITTGNNVGIGTTNPGDILDVVGGNIRIASTNEIRWVDSGTIRGTVEADGSGNLIFGSAGGTERMRIDSSGNVGIGTSSISGKFSVDGSMYAGPGSVSGVAYGFYPASTYGNTGMFSPAANTVAFATTGGERVRIDSGGNVGIGTSSPTYPMELSSSSGAGTQFGITYVPTSVTLLARAGGADVNIGSTGSHPLLFLTSNTERMRIDSSGNVGIGTTAPNELLTVQRNGTPISGLSPSTVASFQSTNASTQSSYLSIIAGSAGSTGQAAIFFGDADDPDIGKVLYRNSDDSMDFVVNAASRMKILSTGNVGIGTTSPAKQLEITKSARATITSLTDATSITSDFDTAQNFAVTLGGNRTLANPSNIDPGQTGSIFVVQDGTGGRTLSFGSYWKFAGGTAPTMSTGAAAVDRIDYVVYTSTAIHAVATLNLS